MIQLWDVCKSFDGGKTSAARVVKVMALC